MSEILSPSDFRFKFENVLDECVLGNAQHDPDVLAVLAHDLALRVEIERLRSALREIADGGSDCPCVDDALWALEGKP